jgi:WD40 repeat protein
MKESTYSTYHSVSGKSTFSDLDYYPSKRELYATTQDKRVVSFSLDTGSQIQSIKPHPNQDPFFESGSYLKISISNERKIAAIACSDKSIFILDLESHQWITRFSGHSGMITGLAFDHFSETLLSTGADALVLGWELKKEKMTRSSSTPKLQSEHSSEGQTHVPIDFPISNELAPKGRWAQVGFLFDLS